MLLRLGRAGGWITDVATDRRTVTAVRPHDASRVVVMADPRDPVADLKQIAFLLERANESTFRVRSFRSAATAVAKLSPDELAQRADAGTLTELSGIGDVTARCIVESLAGEVPVYLRRMQATEGTDVADEAAALRARPQGRLPPALGLVRRRLADRGDGARRGPARS